MGTVTKIKPTKLEAPDIGEMVILSEAASKAGFKRVEIDPDHLLALCCLALDGLKFKCDHKFIDSARCLKCGWQP